MLTMTVIDPTTREGFLEIAASHGRDAAHEARISALKARADNARDFRWHADRWDRVVTSATFDRDWERNNPVQSELMRAEGIGY